MTDLKKMTVAASGKLRQVAYDILNEQTRLLSWQQGGKVPQEQFDSWLAEAEGLYSIGNIKVDEAFLAKAPKLKVIAQASVGYDNIDIAACSAHGIAVGNTPGVLVDAVADLAYGLILDSARSIARGWRHVESGKWGERKGLGFGVDLAGKTRGIVGLGDIGSAVVPRAEASKMKVIYHNRHRRADEAALGISYAGFDDLLQTADFVLVTVNLTPATAGMFNEEAFAKMKPTARFINISRGRVVETQALYEALRSGQIAYAAIDVVEPEPLPGDHPLLTLSNITVTPHIAASTVETRDAMAKLSVVAIAKTVIGTKETLLALCPGEVGILVKTLFYEEEIAENPKAFAHPKLVKAESDMAKQLIQSMTKPFDPSDYHDEFQERLRSAIEEKISGQHIVHASDRKQDTATPVDLMEALQQSLSEMKPKGRRRSVKH